VVTQCSGVCGGNKWSPSACSCGLATSTCDIQNCVGIPPSNPPIACTPCSCAWVETNSSCNATCNSSSSRTAYGTVTITRNCVCNNVESDPSMCSGSLPTVEVVQCTKACNTSSPCAPVSQCKTAEQWKTETWPDGCASRSLGSCYPQQTWYDVICKTPPLSVQDTLAVQYVCANLNIENGVCPSSSITDVISSCKDLLNDCSWTSDQTSCANDYSQSLYSFNAAGTATSESSPVTKLGLMAWLVPVVVGMVVRC